MSKATVREKLIKICSVCSSEIYVCYRCKEGFTEYDEIECALSRMPQLVPKHYCRKCKEIIYGI